MYECVEMTLNVSPKWFSTCGCCYFSPQKHQNCVFCISYLLSFWLLLSAYNEIWLK